MKKLIRVMTLACAACLAAACQTKPNLTSACDVLVPINPKPETNTYLVANDRSVAVSIARHRGRYASYKCGAAE